ncbi:ABC transporter permease [Pseudoalteromonas obscura]|uniref:ABC transporter permease n=1 Tax=Pseudoalteromonas obscura TaxID=3048491 RepID=A0ABT7ET41_9GAMM|nr:ABC transporter permease [Pseudoalteromonas sp. P94(2023)]MDK2598219.1 ABC transporter permease [Pseudoalteromonas sp. P94(2023)]
MRKENFSSISELFKKTKFTVLFVVLLASALAGGTIVSLITWHAYAPLPYPQDESLVWLRGSMTNQKDEQVMSNALSNIAAQYIASQDSSLSMAAPVYYGEALYMDHVQQPQLNMTYTSHEFFSLFGQTLIQGRYFSEQQQDGVTAPEVVVSQCFAERYMPALLAQSALASSPSYSMELDQRVFRVVGVVACERTEPQLYMPNRQTDVFVSFAHVIDNTNVLREHITVRYNTFLVGRTRSESLAAGVPADISAYLNEQFSAGITDFGSSIRNQLHFEYIPLQQYLKGDLQQTSRWLLLSGAAFLLITLVNLLTFYLLDIKKQQAQWVLKTVLGAPLDTLRTAHRWQVSVLFLLAAMFALVLAELGVTAIHHFGKQEVAHLDWLELQVVHYLMVAGIALLFARGFAVFGFKQLSFSSLYQNLQNSGKGQAKQLPQWFSTSVLIAQLSVGLVVLCIGLWTAIYFGNKLSVPSGINAEEVVFVTRHQTSWQHDEQAVLARKQLFLSNKQALLAHPKIASVSLSSISPLDTSYLAVIGTQPGAEVQHTMQSQLVGEDYFSLLGLHLLAGSAFVSADSDARQSVIINRQAATKLGIGLDDIGMTLYGRDAQAVKLVGIVENIYSHALGAPATIYYPHDFYECNMVIKFKPAQTVDKQELNELLQQQASTQRIQDMTYLDVDLAQLNKAAVLSFYCGLGLSFLMTMQVLVGLYGLLGNIALMQKPLLLIKQQVGATRKQLIKEQVRFRLAHFTGALLIATCVILGLVSLLPSVTYTLLFCYLFSVFVLFMVLFTIDIYHLSGQLKNY